MKIFLGGLALWLAFALPAAAASADSETKAALPSRAKLPVSAFAQIPFVEDPSISPDGVRIAGLFGIGGQQNITIMHIFDRNEKTVRVAIPDGTQAIWVRWVNDDNILVGLQALLPVEGDRWYISRLIAINRTTAKITKIFWESAGQDAADVLWVPSDGSTEIVLSAQNSIYTNFAEFWPAVYRVDVQTGKKKQVLSGHEGVTSWITDASGKVRAGIGYVDQSRTFRLLYRSETGSPMFQTISRADTRKREGLITPFLFVPGGDTAFVIHDDDDGRAAIYEQNIKTQTDIKKIYVPPTGEVEGVRLSDDGKMLLSVRTAEQINNVHWVNTDLAELQTLFEKAVPNGHANIVSLSRDRARMLVRIDAPDTPGQLFFYNTAVGRLQKIAAINDVIGGKHLAPVKLVTYKARDGLEIEAILTLPAGREPHDLPFIVMPHGGPWAQDTLGYDYWAQFLADRGYAVLQPNFRGSTGYGEDFVRKGEGQMGLAMQDDITDGVQWAVKEKIADPKRMCIVGASYGGYAAMWGVAKDPELYRCAISIAGVANVRREINDFGDLLNKNYSRDTWLRMSSDFPAISPYNAADRIKAPLLLVHGKRDVTVDPVQSARMYGRMKEAGKNVEFVSLPLADHHFTREADRTTLLTAMESFLAKHNPAD